jgi:hypothetical protein
MRDRPNLRCWPQGEGQVLAVCGSEAAESGKANITPLSSVISLPARSWPPIDSHPPSATAVNVAIVVTAISRLIWRASRCLITVVISTSSANRVRHYRHLDAGRWTTAGPRSTNSTNRNGDLVVTTVIGRRRAMLAPRRGLGSSLTAPNWTSHCAHLRPWFAPTWPLPVRYATAG